ncbi:MAG: beta-lactamase family protein, partial [Mycolicibacterium sp.]|nr:beta-lactamase family protein [Mycolicibacterium sp.]
MGHHLDRTDHRSASRRTQDGFLPRRSPASLRSLDGNEASIRKAVEAGLLSGAVTVVWQNGEVLQHNAIGWRDVGARLPTQHDTIFRIASMSKPITTAAALTLLEEGKLALADPVTRWLPEFADMRVLDDP